MILTEKVINYKTLDIVNLYNFDINFDFIPSHIRKLNLFTWTIWRGGWYHHPLLEIILEARDVITRPPLKMYF